MDGFLWLVSQMTLLLTAAAVVFFVLGWRWRGRNTGPVTQVSGPVVQASEPPPPLATGEVHATTPDARLQADLQEANDHRRNLERELIRVHEELKAARRDAGQNQEDWALAKAEAKRLEARNEELEKEKSRLEKEVVRLQATPVAEEPAAVPAAAKPARPSKKSRSTPAKASASKQVADATSTLARLENDIQARQTLLSALRQEQEDWRRKVASLREKGGDPAGLGLARKSLERVEEQVGEAAASLQQLQHQQEALSHSVKQAAALDQEDDLTRIKGIKSVLRDQLHAFGILSFRQIAEWTEADVEAFSQLLSFKDRARRDQWVRQARELSGLAPEQGGATPPPLQTRGEG